MIQPQPVSKEYAPIEKLPNEILGKVIKRVVSIEQSQLFVALEALQNFAQTSKRMYALMRSNYIHGLVIYSILKIHNELPRHLFKRLDLLLLRKYIQKCELDKVFKMASKVQAVVSESIQKVNTILGSKGGGIVRLDFIRLDLNYSWRSSDFFVLFSPHCRFHEVEVLHPFGKIIFRVPQFGAPFNTRAFMVAESVIHCLQASFHGLCRKGLFKGAEVLQFFEGILPDYEYFQIKPFTSDGKRDCSILPSDAEEISKTDLEEKKGTQALIFSHQFFVFSCYKIQQISGHSVPKNRCRSGDLMRIISEILYFEAELNASSIKSDECIKTHLERVIANMLHDDELNMAFMVHPTLNRSSMQNRLNRISISKPISKKW